MVDFEFTVAPTEEFGMDVPGKDGKSAYEIWLEQGNEGTEEDFLNSLKGDDYVLTEADKEEIADMTAEKVQKPDIPQGMASEDWVNANFQPKGEYVTDEELEEKLKDVSPEGYATEEWTNENFQPKGNYLEEVPAEYITETELEAKGYQTKTEAVNAYQPKGSYATTEQLSATENKIPTKNSQLENDSGYLKGFTETDPTVPSWAKQTSKPSYTKSEVGLGNVANERQYSASNPPPYPVTSVNGSTGAVEVEPKGTAQTKVTNHNADDKAHNDIRLLLSALTKKVNDLLDSDDTTLDQMSEVVAYIKANRELLESYTTEKVNVADIIDNLTTSVSDKPLSAKQGVQLKALIDAIKVPTALSQLTGDSTHRTVTDSEKAAWNAKSNFSGNYNDLNNKPTKVSAFTNDANYVTEAGLTTKGYAKNTDIEQYETLTLGVHTDGKIYLFKNSQPMGIGVEMGVSGDIVGYIDNDNTIVLSGALAEGEYTVKYEMEDGTFVDIGTLSTVEEEVIINQIPISTNTDGTLYVGTNGEKGYKTGFRLSSSSGGESAASGVEVTGFIPCKYGDTISIKDITFASGSTHIICFYKADKSYIHGMYVATSFGGAVNGEVASCTITDTMATKLTSDCGLGFIRISAGEITDSSIITVNQAIV